MAWGRWWRWAAGCETFAWESAGPFCAAKSAGTGPGRLPSASPCRRRDLVEIPAGWSEPEAAGATLVYLTAYQALTMWGPLPPSAVVLVTGASGGVGVAAVQLAAAMGYKVLALSRSPEKSRRLEQLGATATFNPEDPKWRLAAQDPAGAAPGGPGH